MTTVLIAIMLSNWDLSYKAHKQIATYETSVECENVKEQLNKTKNTTTKYICAKEVK